MPLAPPFTSHEVMPLTDALEHWLTRFAAGAGRLLQWTLDPQGRLRAPYLANWSLTPRAAVRLLDYGLDYETSLWDASEGLSDGEACMLMACEDNDRTQHVVLRARLLRICCPAPTPTATVV